MTMLIDISKEIELYGEPANPGLASVFFESYRTLNVGGAIIGFRGAGKTLLSQLAALAALTAGKVVLVVDVSRLLQLHEGTTKLSEISNCSELNEAAERGSLARWVGCGKNATKIDCNKEVEVEGAGFERLKKVLRQLKELHVTPILDGFEDVVLHPKAYGYTVPRLVEDFFDLVDAPPAPFGLALPVELWTLLDLQTKSRIAPTHIIRWRVDDMRQFLWRLCGCELGPLEQLELRNPTAVVLLAEELKKRPPEEVFERRLEDLRRVAQAVSSHAEELFSILKTLWLRQSIYEDVPKRSRFVKRIGIRYSLAGEVVEKIRSYVYAHGELRHLIYELLL